MLACACVLQVFFAGEATGNKYPATTHGAFYTGLQVVRAGGSLGLTEEVEEPHAGPAQEGTSVPARRQY